MNEDKSDSFNDEKPARLAGEAGVYGNKIIDGVVPLDPDGYEDFDAFVQHVISPNLTPNSPFTSGDISRNTSPSFRSFLAPPVSPMTNPIRFELPETPEKSSGTAFSRDISDDIIKTDLEKTMPNTQSINAEKPSDLTSLPIRKPSLPPNSPFELPSTPQTGNTAYQPEPTFISDSPIVGPIRKTDDIFFHRVSQPKIVDSLPKVTFIPPKNASSELPVFHPPTFKPQFTNTQQFRKSDQPIEFKRPTVQKPPVFQPGNQPLENDRFQIPVFHPPSFVPMKSKPVVEEEKDVFKPTIFKPTFSKPMIVDGDRPNFDRQIESVSSSLPTFQPLTVVPQKIEEPKSGDEMPSPAFLDSRQTINFIPQFDTPEVVKVPDFKPPKPSKLTEIKKEEVSHESKSDAFNFRPFAQRFNEGVTDSQKVSAFNILPPPKKPEISIENDHVQHKLPPNSPLTLPPFQSPVTFKPSIEINWSDTQKSDNNEPVQFMPRNDQYTNLKSSITEFLPNHISIQHESENSTLDSNHFAPNTNLTNRNSTSIEGISNVENHISDDTSFDSQDYILMSPQPTKKVTTDQSTSPFALSSSQEEVPSYIPSPSTPILPPPKGDILDGDRGKIMTNPPSESDEEGTWDHQNVTNDDMPLLPNISRPIENSEQNDQPVDFSLPSPPSNDHDDFDLPSSPEEPPTPPPPEISTTPTIKKRRVKRTPDDLRPLNLPSDEAAKLNLPIAKRRDQRRKLKPLRHFLGERVAPDGQIITVSEISPEDNLALFKPKREARKKKQEIVVYEEPVEGEDKGCFVIFKYYDQNYHRLNDVVLCPGQTYTVNGAERGKTIGVYDGHLAMTSKVKKWKLNTRGSALIPSKMSATLKNVGNEDAHFFEWCPK